MSGTFAVCKSADSLSRLIFEASEELVELVHAESFEKPFAMKSNQPRRSRIRVVHVAERASDGRL